VGYSDEAAVVELKVFYPLAGVKNMGKEQKSNKEEKKKPVMTPKEKKAVK